MACINVREGDGLVIIYDLDECGAPVTGANGKLVLSTISEITFEDQIDEGDQVTERNFAGKKVYSDSGQDEIQRVNVNLTSLGINPALDSFLMGSNLYTDSKGYGRVDLADGSTNVAVEVLIKLDASACDGGGAAPVAGWFFPLVKGWAPTGGATLNGTDLVKPQYAGKGYKNPNIFDGSPFDLTRWSTVFDADNEWYGFNLFDNFSLPSANCDPTTFAASS
ncbi:MAG: hypothetical protein ACOYOQ_00045 [Microthrixaceae bacterium]